MAVTIGTLMAYIGADTSDLKKAEGRVKASTDKMSSNFSSLARVIGGVFSAVAITNFAREVVKTADNMTLYSARLRLVTNSQKEQMFVQDQLFKLAQETRQAYGDTVNVYARLGRAARATGKSHFELLEVMGNLNKAIIVSGATTQESAAALIQLSQGLASNRLSGEELRSVMEQIPRVAQAIADGLGVDIGKFREMAFAGKLTAKTVIDSLLTQTDVLNREFAGIPVTFVQAMVKVRNVFDRYVDDLNKSTNATGILVDAVEEFIAFLETPETKQVIENFVKDLPNQILLVKNSVQDLLTIYSKLPEGTTAGLIGAILFGPKAGLIAFLVDAVDLTEALVNSIAGFEAVKEGKLTWFEYATANADELKSLLADIANKKKEINAVVFEPGAATFEEALVNEGVFPLLPSQRTSPSSAPPRLEGSKGIAFSTFQFSDDTLIKMQKVRKELEDFKKELQTEKLQGQLSQELPGMQTPEMFDDYLSEHKQVSEEVAKTWIAAFQTIEGQFANTFQMAMEGDFDAILDSWVNMLQRMVAEWAASQAMTALFGKDYGKGGQGGSGLLGAVGTFIGGLFGGGATGKKTGMASGGMITEPIAGIGTSTGRRYTFGESGAERVTPVNQMGVESNGGQGGNMTTSINIMAADAQSFSDLAKRNPQAIIGPITDALRRGNKGLRSAIQGA